MWSCVVYLFVFIFKTSKSIRAGSGCSYIKLYCKYESYLRYCCLQGSMSWNRMKSTAVVSQTHTWSHTSRHPNYSVSVPSCPWLMQMYTQTLIPSTPNTEIHIFKCRSWGEKRTYSSHDCIFSCSWPSSLPGSQMMAFRHLMQRHAVIPVFGFSYLIHKLSVMLEQCLLSAYDIEF